MFRIDSEHSGTHESTFNNTDKKDFHGYLEVPKKEEISVLDKGEVFLEILMTMYLIVIIFKI